MGWLQLHGTMISAHIGPAQGPWVGATEKGHQRKSADTKRIDDSG